MPRASKASQCVHALRNAECIRGGKGWVLSDVLAKFVVSLDWWRGSATFSPLESSLRGDDLPVEQLMGTPVLKLCTAGCKTKALFDTAAKLCYMPRGAVGNLNPVNHVEDFHVITGSFETDVYEVNVEIAKHSLIAKCGVLPETLLPRWKR